VPAILGFCSVGLLTAFISLIVNLGYPFQIQTAELAAMLSLGLGFAGLALDVERCWLLIAKVRNSKPARPSVIKIHGAGHAAHL
jgi:hypothetical protein